MLATLSMLSYMYVCVFVYNIGIVIELGKQGHVIEQHEIYIHICICTPALIVPRLFSTFSGSEKSREPGDKAAWLHVLMYHTCTHSRLRYMYMCVYTLQLLS